MSVATQRPLKGSRISSFYPVKSLPPISSLDSAFQLQEYISLLIRLDVHNVDKIVAIPGKDQNDSSENGGAKGDEKDTEKDAAGGVNVDPACWVYEHLRRVAQDLSHPLITMLQQECTRSSCPEMKAGEWLYLCVAHGNEGAMEQCCAIDYILHTLDSATALLNSPRAFPSRLSVPATSHRHFTSLCRRLGRIFAHAYFHHREVFEQAEAESSLYARFLALVKYFDLVPLEFLVIPPRMESRADPVEPPRLMGASLEPRRDAPQRGEGGAGAPGPWPGAQDGAFRTGRGKSPPGPAGQARNDSPRKFGRARTDTMVYSEAFSVAEELAKGDLSEVDIDREIAAERAAAAAAAESYAPETGAAPPVEPPEAEIAGRHIIIVPPQVFPPPQTADEEKQVKAEEPETTETKPETQPEIEPASSEPSTETKEESPALAPEESPEALAQSAAPTEEVTAPTPEVADEAATAEAGTEEAAPEEKEAAEGVEAPVAEDAPPPAAAAEEEPHPPALPIEETPDAAPETTTAPVSEAPADAETPIEEHVVVPAPNPAEEEPAKDTSEPAAQEPAKEESEPAVEDPTTATVAAEVPASAEEAPAPPETTTEHTKEETHAADTESESTKEGAPAPKEEAPAPKEEAPAPES
ncbi:hypothetical protein BD413DRAFT_467342 [Trametes elegans]|nr:hypothetical protein BD413DRAFT_467342 [Trametes elegans]